MATPSSRPSSSGPRARSGSGRARLYEAIQRLEDGGLIEETAAGAGGRANGQEAQRRYYRLTERGWTSLRKDLRAFGQLVDVARANPRLRKGLA